MSFPNPMNREELLDLAALDALGQLDEFEEALYTRSFHHAPASVQDEILALQAELVSDPSLLPEEEPSPALRDAVIRGVGDAIEAESGAFAPIATIGRGRANGDGDERTINGPFKLTWTVQFWRAACFALATGMLLSMYFLVEVYRDSQQIAKIALGNYTEQQLERLLGPDLRIFADGNCAVRSLHGVDGHHGAGAIYVDVEHDQAFVVVQGLEHTQGAYHVAILNSDGTTSPLADFNTTHRLAGVRIDDISAMLASAVIQITDATGAVIMTTA